MQQLAPNLWLLQYPLRLLGLPIGRNVTVIRLTSGDLVIHSTAPFTRDDVQRIAGLGRPRWMVDVTRFHDSFARAGREAFPSIIYLGPEVFPRRGELGITALSPAPPEWKDELQLLRIEGMPRVQEHAFFHEPSRTLIVADLLFHFGANASWWTKFVARHLLRLPDLSGTSLVFQLMIRDRLPFCRSLVEIMKWDFQRIIVGHGEVIEHDARGRMERVLSRLGC